MMQNRLQKGFFFVVYAEMLRTNIRSNLAQWLPPPFRGLKRENTIPLGRGSKVDKNQTLRTPHAAELLEITERAPGLLRLILTTRSQAAYLALLRFRAAVLASHVNPLAQ